MSAQNLVPNSGFEASVACPNLPGQLYLAAPWDTLNTSADLFQMCAPSTGNCNSVHVPENFAGYATAHSGDGYAGLMAYSSTANYREYIQTPLIQPLLPGKIYKLSAWIRRSPSCTHAVTTIGMTLSSGALVQYNTTWLGFAPQIENQGLMNISNQWIELLGFIVAAGGENHLTIGNFRDNANSGIAAVSGSGNCIIDGAYYYIDDVSVQRIEENISINGSTITCPGVAVNLFGNSNTIGWWSTAAAPQTSISSLPMLTVTPTTTTTYYFNGIQNRDSVTIEVISPPVVELGQHATLCEGESMILNASCNNCTYQWSTGATSSSLTISSQGIYFVTVQNEGCAVMDTFLLTVKPAPEVTFQQGLKLCPLTSEELVLDAGQDGSHYLWLPFNQTTSSITVSNPGIYSVIKEYANGCSRTSEIEISESCLPTVFVPTGFTPNGDGLNDYLNIETSGSDSYLIRIFNRWGNLVFESSSEAWDGKYLGKDAPQDVYWHHTVINYKDDSGKSRSKEITGSITLIR